MMIVVDLDGTLYDNRHREHLIPDDRSNTAEWVAFNAACENDALRVGVHELVCKFIATGCHVVFMTARGEDARIPTLKKLSADFCISPSFISLVMRPMDDHRSSASAKKDMLTRYLEHIRYDGSVIAIDDDPTVCDAFRTLSGQNVTALLIDSMCAVVTNHPVAGNDNEQPHDCCPVCGLQNGFHHEKCTVAEFGEKAPEPKPQECKTIVHIKRFNELPETALKMVISHAEAELLRIKANHMTGDFSGCQYGR